jgi:hypothetical protein
MCGIVAGLRGKASSGISPEDQNTIMRIITVELLLLTESRGGDATGFALLFEDGNLRGMKHGEKATKVVSDFDKKDKKNFLALMDIWKGYPKAANIALGHCRKRTIGLASNNSNNHPFKVGNILGVHNGSIENHTKIENELKDLNHKVEREGTVDSEMIFHLLSHISKGDKDRLTLDQAEWVVNRLYGKFAVAAININNPYQLMLFRDGKPIEVGISRPTGLIFVASERAFLEAALFRYNRIKYIYGLDHLPDLDLKIGVMPDDHAWIFNMAKEIKDSTDVNDLIEARKMPLTGARLQEWKSYTAPNNNYSNYRPGYNPNSPANRDKKDEEKDDKKKEETDDTTVSGRNWSGANRDNDEDNGKVWKQGQVWCEINRKYVYPEEKNIVRGGGRQTMLPDQMGYAEKIPEDIEDKSLEDGELKENVKFTDHTNYVVEKVKPVKRQSASERSGGVKKVDAKNIVDGEKESTANDLAERYALQHGYFKDTKEACDAAEIVSVSFVGTYDFRRLANKIRKKAMIEAYSAGYEAASEQNKTTSEFTVTQLHRAIRKEQKKKKRAERIIKKLKALALYYIEVAPQHMKPSKGVLDGLNDMLNPHYSLKIEEITELFSTFELSSPSFKLVMKAAEEKEQEKD